MREAHPRYIFRAIIVSLLLNTALSIPGFNSLVIGRPAQKQKRKQVRESEWVVNDEYRIAVAVDLGATKRVQTPVCAPINFAEILQAQGIKGRLDRNSIRVVRYDPATGHALPYEVGSSYEVPYQLSHDFFYQDSGKVWWKIKDEKERNFQVYFDTLDHGPKPAPERIALVGDGDNFLFNNGQPGRIDVGMSASVRYVDWDGDGKKDLLIGSSETHEYGVPWEHCYIYFYKNIGTASAPLFSPGFQLKDQKGDFLGGVIGEWFYFDLVDWDKDGDLDIVVSDASHLHVFENTGQRDRDNLPILKPARKVLDLGTTNDYDKDYATTYDETQKRYVKSSHGYRFFRFVDWDGDGDLDILYAIYQQKMDPNCYTQAAEGKVVGTPSSEDNRNKVCYWGEVLELFEVHENTGTNGKGEPIFAAPKVVRTARGIPLSGFAYGGADYVDWDSDGDLDLITTDMWNYPQGACRVLFHENFGTRDKPEFLLEVPIVARAEDFGIDPNPYVTDWDNDGDQDLLLAGFEGWVKVYENLNPNPKGIPQLEQQGRFVLQINPKITDGEQTRTAVVDWNGDGQFDLIRGGGNGWVQFYENQGTMSDPVFKAPVRLTAAGKEIRFINGLRDCPQGPSEPNSGYTTPVVIDFDNDGDLDLIVGDMRGYQTYFENIGSRREPKLAAGRTIQVGTEPRSFGWRNQVAVGDIDGDGQVEIVTTPFFGRNIYAYKPDRVQDDPKVLKVTKFDLIHLENGETVLPPHGGGNNNGDNMLKLVDWDNDGDLDLLFSSIYYNWYYENVGTKTKPVFKFHGKIQAEGKNLVVTGHANTIDAQDWNGDGKKDLILSGESGWLYYFERSFLEGDLPKTSVGAIQVRGRG